MGYNRLRIDLSERTFKDNRTRWNVNSRLVYALAEHWSAGLLGSSGRFLSYNLDFRLALSPTIEYSVFPYEDATRRSFTFVYTVTGMYHDYTERTIYSETAETRWEQALEDPARPAPALGQRLVRNQRHRHFLHNTDLYRLSIWGGHLHPESYAASRSTSRATCHG